MYNVIVPGQRGWWFSEPTDTFDAHDSTDCCKGYEESLKVIMDAFEKEASDNQIKSMM